MTTTADGLPGWIRAPIALVIGTLLAMSAPTSILLLGWFTGLMRFHALRSAGVSVPRPRWLTGPATRGGMLWRSFGGL